MIHCTNRILPWLLAFLLNACVVIPIHVGEEPPFESDIPDLVVGQTTRSEVIEILGRPAASYHNGKDWVYTASQISWELWGISLSTAGKDPIGDQKFLALTFDGNDVLASKRLEVGEPEPGNCTGIGFCHDGEGHVMRFATNNANLQAKSFVVPEEKCGVYVFGYGLNHRVDLDGVHMGFAFVSKVYFFWNLDPGKHEISVHPKPASTQFNCHDGELIFVNVKARFGTGNTTLELVSENEGRKRISRIGMRLILSESWTRRP